MQYFFFPVSVFTLETEKTKQSHVDFAQGAFQLGVPLNPISGMTAF